MHRKVYLATATRRVRIAAKDEEEAERLAEKYFEKDKLVGSIKVEEVCTFIDVEKEEV